MTGHLHYGDKLAVLRDSIAAAAAAGRHEEPGFAPVPRIQIVTIGDVLHLRDRAVQLPARRDDGYKKVAREAKPDSQGSLDP